LEARLMTLLCKKKYCHEIQRNKILCNLAEYVKEVCGSHGCFANYDDNDDDDDDIQI
jgi:hypothetical protein